MASDNQLPYSNLALTCYSVTNSDSPADSTDMEKDKLATSFFASYIPPKGPPARVLTPTKFRQPKLTANFVMNSPLAQINQNGQNSVPTGRKSVPPSKAKCQFEVVGEKQKDKFQRVSNRFPSIYPRHCVTPGPTEINPLSPTGEASFRWSAAKRLGSQSQLHSKSATTILVSSNPSFIMTPTMIDLSSPALSYQRCIKQGSRLLTPTKFRRGFSSTPTPKPFNPYLYTFQRSATIATEPLTKVGRLLTPTKFRKTELKTEESFLYPMIFVGSGIASPPEEVERINTVLSKKVQEYPDSWSSISGVEDGGDEKSPRREKSPKKATKVTFNDSVAIREPTPASVSSSRLNHFLVKGKCKAVSAGSWDSVYVAKWQSTFEEDTTLVTVDDIKQTLDGCKATLHRADYLIAKAMLAQISKGNIEQLSFVKQYIKHLIVKTNFDSGQQENGTAFVLSRRSVLLRHPRPELRFDCESKSLDEAKLSLRTSGAVAGMPSKLNRTQSVDSFPLLAAVTGDQATLEHNRNQTTGNTANNSAAATDEDPTNPASHRRCVFISYSQVQKAVAHAIWQKLLPTYNVWIDEALHTSDTIEKGIEKADLVIVCYSESYSKSASCENEVSLIGKMQKPVMLICVDQNYDPEGWLEQFVQQQQSSITTLVEPVLDEDLDSLLTDMEHLMP